ncbi:MAG: NAD(P)/FAD-dependent oxidoreductase [Candidatus Bipolaricaulia bacterium]
MAESADVLIVGGGIIGATLLDRLAREGVHALLIEREGLASGTTGRSLAILGTQQPTALDIRLRQEGVRFYGELIEEYNLSFVRCGYLHLARSAEQTERIRETVALARELGEPVTLLAPSELDEHLPGLRSELYVAAGYAPQDGYLDGHELVAALARRAGARARSRGARVQILTGTAVLDLTLRGDRVQGVRTPKGDVSASCVVVAAGPWTRRLLAPIGVSLPLSGVPGQILVVRHTLGKALPMAFDRDSHLYLRGEGPHRVLLGELDKAYRPDGGSDPDRIGDRPAPDFVERATAGWTAALPALAEGEAAGGWVGLRTVTPDARPVIGPVGPDGLWVVTGFSGHGIQLAPAAARMAVEGLLGNPQAIPQAFSPRRFAAPADRACEETDG